ncbi:unnamed protein product [Amoebophrya sp. A120]|nr:unnamed protein product [Amoebophrya sp. A120]|eukprot:GSA120T00008240001.1
MEFSLHMPTHLATFSTGLKDEGLRYDFHLFLFYITENLEEESEDARVLSLLFLVQNEAATSSSSVLQQVLELIGLVFHRKLYYNKHATRSGRTVRVQRKNTIELPLLLYYPLHLLH